MRLRRACSASSSLLFGVVLTAMVAFAAPPSDAGGVRVVQPPGVAHGAYRGECRRLNRQIARYTEQAGTAIDLGNNTMLEASYRRIGHLTTRRSRLCPLYVDDRAGEQLVKLLRLGGKVALKMFTMGII